MPWPLTISIRENQRRKEEVRAELANAVEDLQGVIQKVTETRQKIAELAEERKVERKGATRRSD